MKTLIYLVKRNTKLFFKDRAMFLSSMITPMILILLYVTFLAKVYRDSFMGSIPEGLEVSSRLIEGFIGGWMFSSLLAVCTVTISFCSNLLMIQDKYLGTIQDLTISPVKKSTIGLAYFISSAIVSMIICYTALIIGFIYLGCVGWYLSFVDVLLLILDVFILTLFGTALASIVNFFLTTQGQASAVGTTVSCAYGFICGAYMPLSQFSQGIRNVLMFFPGTYGTNLIHNHFLSGVMDEFGKIFPSEVVSGMEKNFDLSLRFFDNQVPQYVCYIVFGLTIVALISIFVCMNKFSKRKISR